MVVAALAAVALASSLPRHLAVTTLVCKGKTYTYYERSRSAGSQMFEIRLALEPRRRRWCADSCRGYEPIVHVEKNALTLRLVKQPAFEQLEVVNLGTGVFTMMNAQAGMYSTVTTADCARG